jgi:hypothetical protein
MASIITQNIGTVAAQQVRSPEPVTQAAQQASTPDRAQLINTSRISAEQATVSPDGGAKTRAADGGRRRVHSTFEPKEQDEEGNEGENQDALEKGHPSSNGTGHRVSRMA